MIISSQEISLKWYDDSSVLIRKFGIRLERSSRFIKIHQKVTMYLLSEPLTRIFLHSRRLWRSITIQNFAARFARCSLVAPSALPKIME